MPLAVQSVSMTSNPQPYVTRLLGLVGDDDPRAILAATPSRVSSLIAGADPGVLAQRPGPSKWSINQIVAHLADAELVGGYRLRMIAATDGTHIQAFDQDRWAATFDYRACDAAESARLFAAYRTGTLRMLDRLATALMDNHGMHEERGKETMRHLVRLYAGHDRNHLEQIERILGASDERATPRRLRSRKSRSTWSRRSICESARSWESRKCRTPTD